MMSVSPAPVLVRSLLAAVAGVLATLPAPAYSVDVTACGQSIPEGTVGVLVADLVCPNDDVILLERGATLRMNGHSLSAASPEEGQVGIGCVAGRCRIEGPGQVSGFQGVAIFALDPSRLEVSGVQVTASGIGIHGNRVTLSDVQLSGNADWGASADRLVATNVSAIANQGDGLGGKSIRGTDITTTGNGGSGVRCNRIKAERLTSTGNGEYGVRSIYPGVTKLDESTLSNNAVADIGSQRIPRLRGGTTCETSRRLSEAGADLGTWGVCSND
jgi:hypothetical protein